MAIGSGHRELRAIHTQSPLPLLYAAVTVASSSPLCGSDSGLFLSSMRRRQWRLPMRLPSPMQRSPDPANNVSNSSDL
uniref:Uncharacterized protein n=1 Tax=Oryza meridionalis TaxID=40149 RepID=A0A0E0BVX9_9ORYZ